MFTTCTPYRGLHADDEDDEESSEHENPTAGPSGSSSRQSSKKKKKKVKNKYSKGLDAMGFEPSTRDNNWVVRSDIDPNFPLVPSAKTTALKALLLKLAVDAPGDKASRLPLFEVLILILIHRS